MPDIARRFPADLKPLASGLSPEVLDWAAELRTIWAATGLSMNQFASLHPIDKGTISRYLNGQRVPRDRWFLDKLLAIQADYGQQVTPDVREHLATLQLRALEVAHPHEYRVRRVSDELEIALTSKLEAERYARALEEQLTDRNRQASELAEARGRLRAGWDADRIAMQADCERLTQEIGQLAVQLHLAQERATQAERRCQLLEDVLDHLDAHAPAIDEYRTVTMAELLTAASWEREAAAEISRRVRNGTSLAVALADIDIKTGLLAAGTWDREAEAEINRAVQAGIPVAVALVDIDRFKAVNDIYGHPAGDKALRAVTDALRSQLRAYDLAGRFGGEEFAILLPHAREADAINFAERLRAHIAAMSIPVGDDAESGPYVTLTISAGVATMDGENRELTDLLAAADSALYHAKENGRNKTHVITVRAA
jgi:diguanylate cyclase (GGDEF)-like protein